MGGAKHETAIGKYTIGDEAMQIDAPFRAVRGAIGSRRAHLFAQQRMGACLVRTATRASFWKADRIIKDMVEALPDAVLVVGGDGVIRLVNQAAEDLFGHPGTGLAGQLLGYSISDGAISEINIPKDGQIRTAEMRVVPWIWLGKLAHLIAVRDISRLKESEARLEHLATHDALTGLPNRRLLGDELQRAIAGAKERSGKFAVLFIDLDRFKSINDSLGHSAGDELLVNVADRLRLVCRGEDLLAHSSGDEFVLVANDIVQTSDAVAVARRLLKSLDEPFTIASNKVYIDASIGISFYPEDGETADELIDHADAAMYRCKLDQHGGVFLSYIGDYPRGQ